MNLEQFTQAVSDETGLSKKQSKEAINAVFNVIKKTVTSDEKVSIANFGIFSQEERAARDGINPATKAKIKIAAKKYCKFKASSKFYDQ